MEFNPPQRLVWIRPRSYLRYTLITICRFGPNVSFQVEAGLPPGLGCSHPALKVWDWLSAFTVLSALLAHISVSCWYFGF